MPLEPDSELNAVPSQTTYQTLVIHDLGPVRLIALNLPAARNSITRELRLELAEAIVAADGERSVRAIVLAGNGPVFCSGGDLRTLGPDPVVARERLGLAGNVTRSILACSTPTVAAVQGGAWGAGMSLATACDVVVIGRNAKLVASFGRIGLVGDSGAFHVLSERVGRARAREILLLGSTITGEQAAREGLATIAVDDVDVRRIAFDHAIQLASAGESVNATTKQIFREGHADFESALGAEVEAQIALLQGAAFAEGVAAFREKREPCWWDDLDIAPEPGVLDATGAEV